MKTKDVVSQFILNNIPSTSTEKVQIRLDWCSKQFPEFTHAELSFKKTLKWIRSPKVGEYLG